MKPMLFADQLCLLRGGGDLATGVASRLHRAGFPVVVCELAEPLTIRRTVALSTAIETGETVVEGMVGRRVESIAEATALAPTGMIPVLVSPQLPEIEFSVVVDARVAKRNVDTIIDDAPLVIGLGPGFTAGVDCRAVVETMRGHHLGRVIWEGSAAPDTGIPGSIGGQDSQRVLRAPVFGNLEWDREIGDTVAAGDLLGRVGAVEVIAGCAGVIRGLLSDQRLVDAGTKIADIDPRADRTACFEISDKARAVAGGVLEAVLVWLNR